MDFQNLILERDLDRCRFRGGRNREKGLVRPEPDVLEELRGLYAVVSQAYQRAPGDPDFLITHGGRQYRVAYIKSEVFALRRAVTSVPRLAQCGIHPRIIEHLLGLRAGTVLFFGKFSTGKTTAASAYLVEFVRRNGTLGLTLEDPAELALEGDYDGGRIYQLSIRRSEIEEKTQDIMRTNFDALMVSEIRTPLMGQVIFQAGAAGRLVSSTGHGEKIPDGLNRLISIAGGTNTSGEAGAQSNLNLLADSFQAAILMEEVEPHRYGATSYLLRSNDVAACIRKGDFSALNNCIDMLMARLASRSAGPLVD